MTTPFRAGNGKPIGACEVESLGCAHHISVRQATARSWRAQAASRRSLFSILPEPLFGSSVWENSMLRGTLKLARDRRQYAINSSAVSVFPGLRTTQPLRFRPFRIGYSKDRHFAHRRMCVNHGLDFAGINILAARDDHVLQAIENVKVPVGVLITNVAGSKKPFRNASLVSSGLFQ